MLQKYKYHASIMPDAPDIVFCSKLCRHSPTDPKFFAVFFSTIFELRGIKKHLMTCPAGNSEFGCPLDLKVPPRPRLWEH